MGAPTPPSPPSLGRQPRPPFIGSPATATALPRSEGGTKPHGSPPPPVAASRRAAPGSHPPFRPANKCPRHDDIPTATATASIARVDVPPRVPNDTIAPSPDQMPTTSACATSPLHLHELALATPATVLRAAAAEASHHDLLLGTATTRRTATTWKTTRTTRGITPLTTSPPSTKMSRPSCVRSDRPASAARHRWHYSVAAPRVPPWLAPSRPHLCADTASPVLRKFG